MTVQHGAMPKLVLWEQASILGVPAYFGDTVLGLQQQEQRS